MYINGVGHYLPEERVPNEYFLDINGLTDEWIYTRTGIKTRSKIKEGEDTNTMGLEAVKSALKGLPYPIQDVDLIVGGSYTPSDTVGTLAHYIQQQYDISNTQTLYISSACSSYVNALEIVEGYFALGKASKALIIVSECNTLYNPESDSRSGHLWGDGAAAAFISKDRVSDSDYEVIDVVTHGLANVGKGPDAVWLHPHNEGLIMPAGKDVFLNACVYMADVTREIVERNNLKIGELSYLIPHQANIRIIKNVQEQLEIPDEKVLNNIERLGNTGCASTVIAISENKGMFKKGNLVCQSVFGGGYSSGAILFRV
ncbi:MAG: ketoacyl-ACP synthase III [Bacteroidales bacterium]|nr:ketoacyl-ACP synthase III [Bacteroidales bacterium]